MSGNIWTLIIGVAIMAVLMLTFMAGDMAMRNHTLATKNKIEAIKLGVQPEGDESCETR